MSHFILVFTLVFFFVVFLVWLCFWFSATQDTTKNTVNVRNVGHNMTLLENYWLDQINYERFLLLEIFSNYSSDESTRKSLDNIKSQLVKGYTLILGKSTGFTLDTILEQRNNLIRTIFIKIKLGQDIKTERASLVSNNEELAAALTNHFEVVLDKDLIFHHLEDISIKIIAQVTNYARRDFASSLVAFNEARSETLNLSQYLSMGYMQRALDMK